jgi:hypothetical protein
MFLRWRGDPPGGRRRPDVMHRASRPTPRAPAGPLRAGLCLGMVLASLLTAAAQDWQTNDSQFQRNETIARDAEDGQIDGQMGTGSSPGVPYADPLVEFLLRQAWRSLREGAALQREYDVADITFSRSQVRHLLGVWRGAYVCKQGRTGLTLSLDHFPDGSVRGVFNFYPLRNEAAGPARGSYAVRILIGRTHVFVEPLRWLDQPDGYIMVGMSGIVRDTDGSFAGEIQSDGCGNFALTKLPG